MPVGIIQANFPFLKCVHFIHQFDGAVCVAQNVAILEVLLYLLLNVGEDLVAVQVGIFVGFLTVHVQRYLLVAFEELVFYVVFEFEGA